MNEYGPCTWLWEEGTGNGARVGGDLCTGRQGIGSGGDDLVTMRGGALSSVGCGGKRLGEVSCGVIA